MLSGRLRGFPRSRFSNRKRWRDFVLNQQLIEKILDYAVCHGADFAEVFYEDVRRSNLTVLDQKVLDSSAGAEEGRGHPPVPRDGKRIPLHRGPERGKSAHHAAGCLPVSGWQL